MKKELFNLTIKEFTRLLCDSEEIYTLEMRAFAPDGSIERDDVCGTYENLYCTMKLMTVQQPNNENAKNMLEFVKRNLFDYNMTLENIDIYNYLQYKTDNFDATKKYIVWREMQDILVDIMNEKDCYDMEYYDSFKSAMALIEEDIYTPDGLNLSKTAQEIMFPSFINENKQAQKYFSRAIEAGYMQQTDYGFKWVFGGNRGQIRLGYLCFKAFAEQRPINDLEALFGVKKLSSSITQASYKAERSDVKAWRKEMEDKIFHD